MMDWSLVTITALVVSVGVTSSSSTVKNIPGYNGDLPFYLETGYIGAGNNEEIQLFYTFVESERNPSTDPVLLWFTGGPGCSGLQTAMFSNGPLAFDFSDFNGIYPELKVNPYRWTKVLNQIFIDAPVGTGFSYSETSGGYHSSDKQWIEQAYIFLQKWFRDHPKFLSNPLYIGGGSYSGIIVPPLVQKAYEDYKAGHLPLMDIQGYVLGSPYTDFSLDRNSKVQAAYHLSLLSDDLYQSATENCNGDFVNIEPSNWQCLRDYQAIVELVSDIRAENILEPRCVSELKNQRMLPEELTSSTDLEDWCREKEYRVGEMWLNDPIVRKALHIREGTKDYYKRCNGSLAYTKDIFSVVNYHQNLTKTNLRALVYCSDLDLSVPHLGTQKWIKSLNLTKEDNWRAWFVHGQVAGYTERYKFRDFHLTYISIKGAGHVAETYRPRETYHMIDRWFSYYPL